MTTYRAEAERSGDWWAIGVPGLRGAHSQARTRDEVEPMIREAISLLLEVPEDSFAVEVTYPTR